MPLPPIVFEDDHLVAFDKPAGMLVVPAVADRKRESLMPLLRARYGENLANVHRLDPEASGLFLCAKTKSALDFLSGQFQSKTAQKKYRALVVVLPVERAARAVASVRGASGVLPDAFSVEAALGDDPREKGRVRLDKTRGGKDSVTEVRVLERFGRFAMLEVQPITGRTHQIRVHLAAVGAPILNDALYGDPEVRLLLSDLKRGYKGREAEKPLLARLALHANELTVLHPGSRESFSLLAPLPRDFEIALKNLERYSKNQ